MMPHFVNKESMCALLSLLTLLMLNNFYAAKSFVLSLSVIIKKKAKHMSVYE